MMSRTVHLRITGVVQGVYYRGWTAETARARGLTGWVRNRRDGSVEAFLHGSEAEIAGMIASCWEGPPAADVEDVSVIGEGGEAPATFEVLPTA